MHRLTAAIACYNQAHYLPEAIESILAQHQSGLEILVVDDGSTEGDVAAVCARYPGVTCIRQPNGGLSSARNRALRESSAPVITFLDADDMYRPGAFAHALRELAERPDAAFVWGGHARVSERREVLWESLPRSVSDVFASLLQGNHIAMHATVFYRTAALRSEGGFDESLRACEDYDVYLRLTRHRPAASYDFIAADYRRHATNITNNALLMLDVSLAVLGRHRENAATSPERRAAYSKGVRAWRRWCGNLLAEDIVEDVLRRRAFAAAWSKLSAGAALDPALPLRLVRRVAGVLIRGK